VSYQFDAVDRRSRADWSYGTFWSYGYNDRGEVTSRHKQFAAGGALVGGSQYEYGYDDIGNRTVARRGGDAGGEGLEMSDYWDANAVNQLTSRALPGRVWVSGEAPVELTLQGFADLGLGRDRNIFLHYRKLCR
jgi:hypothetical protein